MLPQLHTPSLLTETMQRIQQSFSDPKDVSNPAGPVHLSSPGTLTAHLSAIVALLQFNDLRRTTSRRPVMLRSIGTMVGPGILESALSLLLLLSPMSTEKTYRVQVDWMTTVIACHLPFESRVRIAPGAMVSSLPI